MIKVTLDDQPKQDEKPFPKLMVLGGSTSSGTIVLFQKPNCGIVVHGMGHYNEQTGYFTRDWYMPHFTDYNGPVTIQNA